jgi:hypothetical protein
MITLGQFLRRSLLAPLLMPIMAWLGVGARYLLDGTRHPFDAAMNDPVNGALLSILGISFLFGSIPYAWLLYGRQEEIRTRTGEKLEAEIQMLPFRMIPYYWIIVGIGAVLATMLGQGANGLCMALLVGVSGTLSIVVLGYVYVFATFFVLRLFQSIGLVEKTRERYDYL